MDEQAESAPLTLEEAERKAIRQAIEAHVGNITRAAKYLGVTRQGLQLKLMRKYPDLGELAAEFRAARNGSNLGKPRSSPIVAIADARRVLNEQKGNVRASARALGIPESTLRRTLGLL